MNKLKIILITGEKARGKTTLMSELSQFIYTQKMAPVISLIMPDSGERSLGAGVRARKYWLHLVYNQKTLHKLLWMDELGCFNQQNLDLVTYEMKKFFPKSKIVLIDNLGMVEVQEKGFFHIVQEALKSESIETMIISAQTKHQESLIKKFYLDGGNYQFSVVNLDDEEERKNSFLKIKGELQDKIGDKIALFSTINGFVEISIGSLLHTFHIPLRGTMLSFAQGFMMTLFAKELKGKGIIWIAVMTSGLKSFSPSGAKLKPMLYIFLQGFFYVCPTWFLGWSFISAIIGYALLVLSNLFLPLFVDYLIFGQPIIDAYIEGASKFFSFFGLKQLNLLNCLIIFSLIKISLSTLFSLIAYFFSFSSFLKKMERKIEKIDPTNIDDYSIQSWRDSVRDSFGDLLVKKFYIPFIFSLILIYFLTNLKGMAITTLAIRGIILSWFAFLISRRIDMKKVVTFFEQQNLSYIGQGMKKSAGILNSYIKRKK